MGTPKGLLDTFGFVSDMGKGLIQSIRFRYNFSSSERYIKYLRNKGCSIGEECIFYGPRDIIVDITQPCLITIGNNVRITSGVVILTHGADWHVLREMYHKPFGSAGPVTIKDNVFIGMNSIILKDVTIHENSIIGAGSVVVNDVASGTVAAGNPAKPIMSIEEYFRKREGLMLEEARRYAQAIFNRYRRLPVPEDFKEFFFLFIERDPAKFKGIPVKMQLGKYYQEFLESKPYFDSFEDFLKYCNLLKS
jgi:acetyltransferase-like isoleucine patch superfamily enzyme